MKSRSIRWTAVAVVAGILVALAPSATAQTPRPAERSIENIQQHCIKAIDDRLARIDRLQNAVASSHHVTARHEAILEDQLAEAQAGLTRLKAQIRTEDDREELKAECKSIVEDFRIYVLVTPRTMLTLAADAATATANKLAEVAARIQNAIDEAAAAGKHVTQAQAEHDSMVAHTEAAKSAAWGVPDTVLPLTPQDWPEAQALLRQASADLRSAREDLREGKQDGHDAVEALKAA